MFDDVLKFRGYLSINAEERVRVRIHESNLTPMKNYFFLNNC